MVHDARHAAILCSHVTMLVRTLMLQSFRLPLKDAV
jgi:hypothetical protein